MPTPGEISRLTGVGICIEDEGEINVVEVLFGTDEFAIESAIRVA